ncbi:MAG TPA: transcription termination/antitermination protein NusG [Gemmataceae bacterium]|jgi:transcriptional antiterminator NusG|nr:transcription termination/antitermination protein NusG [Gemmataceae bacterium]
MPEDVLSSDHTPAAPPRTEAAPDTPEEAREETPAGAPAGEQPPTPAVAAEEKPPEEPSNKRWYVVKVQSGREETIKDAIERRVKIEGLEEFFSQIIVPVERVTEIRNGKRVVKERKLFPGYLMVEVEYNDRILYLFRETSGVGDFVGGTVNRPPPPMPQREVDAMLGKQGALKPGEEHAKPEFERGDRVKVKDGTFAGMEGEVKEILEALGRVRVELTIFGRPVPVELEYWQVEQV